MSYIDSNLLTGEVVVYRARLHPIVYVPAAFVGALALVIFIGGTAAGAAASSVVGPSLVALLVAGMCAGIAYMRIATSEFAVTNRRVIMKVGWLRSTSLELFLPKVEGIAVSQSILGRLCDFGTIIVSGTGGSREPFAGIAGPMEFRRQVQQQI